MIEHIEFKFNTQRNIKTDYDYFPKKVEIKSLDFKPGVNILVGGNGCGKTSILNIIRELTFCRRGFYSISKIGNRSFFYHEKVTYLMEDVDISCNYDLTTFNCYNKKIQDGESNDLDLAMNFGNSKGVITQYFGYKESSDGQNVVGDLRQLLGYMFDGIDGVTMNFDKKDFIDASKGISVNDYYQKIYKNIIDYIDSHNTNHDNIVTMLMDEPDKGLDISNIDEILSILSYYRDDTQIIASIHNPIILLNLMNNPNVNIIEIESGYMNKFKEFIKTHIDFEKLIRQ